MNEPKGADAAIERLRQSAAVRPILETMRELAAAWPEAPVRYEDLPRIPNLGDGFPYAAGALDTVSGRFVGGDTALEAARAAMGELRSGAIGNWRQLEDRFRCIRAIEAIDGLLSADEPLRITRGQAALFWEMAQKSADFEAVKWGIAIGSLDCDEGKLADLTALARHPEFTLYVCVAVRRMAGRTPQVARALVDLLPVSEEWGVIKLVEHILEVECLKSDLDVQRLAVIHGMENCCGIPMEVAFTLASAVDLHALIERAREDARLRTVLCDLFSTLFSDRVPRGGIADLKEPIPAVGHLMEVLRACPPNVHTFALLLEMRDNLATSGIDEAQQPTLRHDIHEAWQTLYDERVLASGLRDEATRWMAADIICRTPAPGLRSRLRELVSAQADRSGIAALAQIGDRNDLELLLSVIPRIVSIEERAQRPMSQINVFGPEHEANSSYAQIVGTLGRLRTPPAVGEIKRALRDYAPEVRLAACRAAAEMPRETWDREILTQLEERQVDPMWYVQNAARSALHPEERGG